MDFSNAEKEIPVQTITLKTEDFKPLQESSAATNEKKQKTESTTSESKEEKTEQQTTKSEETITKPSSNEGKEGNKVESTGSGKGALGVANIPLQFVKFQTVSCLTLFVESNLGDKETTVISGFTAFGGHTKQITKVEEVLE
jgi:hypothetical protein